MMILIRVAAVWFVNQEKSVERHEETYWHNSDIMLICVKIWSFRSCFGVKSDCQSATIQSATWLIIVLHVFAWGNSSPWSPDSWILSAVEQWAHGIVFGHCLHKKRFAVGRVYDNWNNWDLWVAVPIVFPQHTCHGQKCRGRPLRKIY